MLPIYFILIIAAIASAFIVLAIYLKFYNKKINERLQKNIRDEKPLPNMRKVTLITFISSVLSCIFLAVIITFIKQPNEPDNKPFQEEALRFYLSPEPVSSSDISNDMFIEGHDGSITYFTSTTPIVPKAEEEGSEKVVTVDTEQPAFLLSMKLPVDITDKVDGMGISCSYLIENNIVASSEYTYPASYGDTLWRGFVDKPGQFIGKVFYYSENGDGSYDIIFEESIILNIE